MNLDEILTLPTGALVALGILVVIELTLLVVGVIAWAGTPEDRMPPPNRWVWLVVVLFVQIFGPITFLVLRRQQARYAPREDRPVGPPVAPAAVHRTATDTADLLYGRQTDGRREDGRREDGRPEDGGR